MSEADSGVSTRPRLNLKPRDEGAARQIEAQRTASGKNPFGDAKPRESVLATRTGKSETEILKDEVRAEKPKLRLTPQQVDEKRAAEAAVAEIEVLIAAEEADDAKAPLLEELKARQGKLDELVAGFERLAVEAAIKGEFVRPSERRRQQMLEAEAAGHNGYGGGDPMGYGGGRGGYGGGGGGYGGGGGRGYHEPRGDGPRGFPGYQDRPVHEGGGRRAGSGNFDRDGGRDYRGPSDRDNAETFGLGAAGYGRDRPRGGGGGGRGGRGGFNDGGYGGDDYYGSGGGPPPQDRY